MPPLVQQTVASRAFDAHTWACEPLAGVFPARCGHHALQVHLNEQQCVMVVGGCDGEEWQPSAFLVSLAHASDQSAASEKPNVLVTDVQCDCVAALEMMESAVCSASQNQIVVCGGRRQAYESNRIWIGELSCDTSEATTGMRLGAG